MISGKIHATLERYYLHYYIYIYIFSWHTLLLVLLFLEVRLFLKK